MGISNYALCVCIIGIVSGILSIIAPNGNVEKVIKLIVSIYILFVIIYPIVNYKDFSNEFYNYDKVLDTKIEDSDMWGQTCEIIETNIKDIALVCIEDEAMVVCKKIELEIIYENEEYKVDKAIIYIPTPVKGNKNTLKQQLYQKTNIHFEVIIE